MPVKLANCVVSQPVSWLWPDMLPAGKLTLLDGDPDLGKSLIALDLYARLSTGRPFPDGRPGTGPASALVLSAEDAPHDTIVPRLTALGADLGRVSVWQRDLDDEPWPWRFPGHARLLDDALTRTDARLAVIDPIMAFLDERVLSASDASVRTALAPLIHLADKHRCTLLMHRHLTKKGGNKALYRGLGSIGFLAACRFAMLVAPDPFDPGRSILAPVRHSLSKPPPSLAYRITSGAADQPALEWLGPASWSADQLLESGVRGRHGARDRAVDFLEQMLADGPRVSTEVWAAARKAGLSERTVQRAKKSLNIRSHKEFVDGRTVTYALLPGQVLLTGNPDKDEFMRYLADLAKKDSPPTPLDDEDPPPRR
jgi:hypothetical protein